MNKFVPDKNIIDAKNSISLESFTRFTDDDVRECIAINENCQVEKYTVENLEYFKIKNFLKNPDKLRKFLSKFPCEDKMLTLESKGTSGLDSKAPGFQQVFDDIYFSEISKYLHDILNKNKIINYGWRKSYWEYYSNCVYSGMKSYKCNYIPHTDSFKIAANIYLTDVKNTGTSFFKYKAKNKIYDSCLDFRDPENIDDMKDFIQNQNNIINSSPQIQDWVKFEGDDKFIKYHYIPADYNSVTMYRGNYWHNIDFDASVPDTIRYSLVSVLAY